MSLGFLAESVFSSWLPLPGVYSQCGNPKCCQVLPSFILLGLSKLCSCRGLPEDSPTTSLLPLVAVFCHRPNFNSSFPLMADFQVVLHNGTQPVLPQTQLNLSKATLMATSTLSNWVPVLQSSSPLFSWLTAFCYARVRSLLSNYKAITQASPVESLELLSYSS